MFDDMPEDVRKAAMDLMFGLTPDEERQMLMASTELDMITCEPERLNEVQEGFLRGLASMSKASSHRAGLFMMVWVGMDPKGNVSTIFEMGGNVPTMLLAGAGFQKQVAEFLKDAKRCSCHNCVLDARLRATKHMENTLKKQAGGPKLDA